MDWKRRKNREQDLDRELRAHLELEAEERQDAGLTPEDAHYAARRAFELVTDYVKQRHQFGQPIGRFQAIQHKLANGLIALEGVRLPSWSACSSSARGSRSITAEPHDSPTP